MNYVNIFTYFSVCMFIVLLCVVVVLIWMNAKESLTWKRRENATGELQPWHTLKDPVSIVSELLSSITIVSIKWLIRYENKEGGVLSDAEDFNLGKQGTVTSLMRIGGSSGSCLGMKTKAVVDGLVMLLELYRQNFRSHIS